MDQNKQKAVYANVKEDKHYTDSFVTDGLIMQLDGYVKIIFFENCPDFSRQQIIIEDSDGVKRIMLKAPEADQDAANSFEITGFSSHINKCAVTMRISDYDKIRDLFLRTEVK